METRQPCDALRLNLAAALDSLAGTDLAFLETAQATLGRTGSTGAQALAQIGDVVLSRKGEDIVAYFLAAALDDARQGVTHVVRGEDLFEFTAVQVILPVPPRPAYARLPPPRLSATIKASGWPNATTRGPCPSSGRGRYTCRHPPNGRVTNS